MMMTESLLRRDSAYHNSVACKQKKVPGLVMNNGKI